MSYIVGIDGGGTKTVLRVVDCEKKVLCELLGGGINRYSMPDNTVRDNLGSLLNEASRHISNARFAAICLGTAGAVNKHDKSFYENILLDYSDRVEVYDDAYIMLFENLHSNPGILFTCGTGSIFYGKNKNGKVSRIGGWGHIMSDEGSGYEIGLTALKTIAKNHDLQKKPTKLLEFIYESFGCSDYLELVSKVNIEKQDKKHIAMLAEQVNRAALLNDIDSISILENSAMRLCDMCELLVKQLSLDDSPFLIMTNGSVIQKIDLIRRKFESEIKKRFPMCTVQNVTIDPAWGAIEIAQNSLMH